MEGVAQVSKERIAVPFVLGFLPGADGLEPDGQLEGALEAAAARSDGRPVLAISGIERAQERAFASAVTGQGLPWLALLSTAAAESQELSRLLTRSIQRRIETGSEVDRQCALLLEVDHVLVGAGGGAREDLERVLAFARARGVPVQHVGQAFEAPAAEQEDHALRHWNEILERRFLRSEGARWIDDVQAAFEREASEVAPRFRGTLSTALSLQLVATLTTLLVLVLGVQSSAASGVKFGCLVLSFVALWLLGRTHAPWRRARFAAEIARSAAATWALPRARPILEGLDDEESRPLRRALRFRRLVDPSLRESSLADFRASYATERIEGQIAYFQRAGGKAQRQLQRCKQLFSACMIVAIACGFATGKYPVPALQLAAVALPAVASFVLALILAHDMQRRAALYHQMVQFLELQRQLVTAAPTWDSLTRLVQRTEHRLLVEVREWSAFAAYAARKT